MVKKIGFGAAFWGIMFLSVSALLVSPLPDLWQKVIEIVVAGVASYVLAMIYFKKQPGGRAEGIKLWVLFMVVGTILDLLITVQYVRLRYSYLYGLKTFYSMWSLWVSFAVSFVAIVLAAKSNKNTTMAHSISQPLMPPPPRMPLR